MKTYKLIKTYPGSPCFGFIASPKGNNIYYVNSNWIEPENYPEFWEEVIELDYEILTVSPSEKHTAYYNKQLLFTWSTCDKNIELWDIRSVKRLSDGIIFTLGDKVSIFKGITNIKAFRILSNNEFVIDFDNKCSAIGVQYISKVIEPIFTTDDGVAIFEGDSYYSVYTSDYTYEKLHWSILKPANNTCLNLKAVGILRFSTLEKAEKYILDNKPKRLYTEDEMERALENWGMCKVDINYVNEFLNI